VTARLAQEAGYPSLTLLTLEERRGYEARAIEELRERDRPRELRQSIRELLAQRGVTLTPEAIQQFVARHRDEPPAELMRSVSRYLERPRRRSGKPSP
jgi:DNA polymerase III delta subunit